MYNIYVRIFTTCIHPYIEMHSYVCICTIYVQDAFICMYMYKMNASCTYAYIYVVHMLRMYVVHIHTYMLYICDECIFYMYIHICCTFISGLSNSILMRYACRHTHAHTHTHTHTHTHAHTHTLLWMHVMNACCAYFVSCPITRSNTLQHTATRCNTLQHTATQWNMLQATHCNTL